MLEIHLNMFFFFLSILWTNCLCHQNKNIGSNDKPLYILRENVLFSFLSEDADKLRIHTVSEAGSLDALEKMVDGSDSEDASDDVEAS